LTYLNNKVIKHQIDRTDTNVLTNESHHIETLTKSAVYSYTTLKLENS